MARASRDSAVSCSCSPRSRMTMRAPVGASPAASVAPPMPDPTMITSGLEAWLNTVGSDMGPLRFGTSRPHVRGSEQLSPLPGQQRWPVAANGLNAMRRGRVEQHRLVEVERKHLALSDADVGIRPHPRGDLLAGNRGNDECVRSGRLNNLDLAGEGRDALGFPVRAFEVADGFG